MLNMSDSGKSERAVIIKSPGEARKGHSMEGGCVCWEVVDLCVKVPECNHSCVDGKLNGE